MSIIKEPELKTNKWGDKYWVLDGKYHREDGPAIIAMDGMLQWRINGLLHREDGPAIVYTKHKHQEYFLKDKEIDKKEFIKILIKHFKP